MMMNHVVMRRCFSAASTAIAQSSSSRCATRRLFARQQQQQQLQLFSSGKPPQADDEELTEWIPPNRPLPGDKGRSDLYDTSTADHDVNDHDAVEEEEETLLQEELQEDDTTGIDWLSTRRAKQAATSMDMPNSNRKFADAELEILEGRLLSATEMEQCLTSMGGVNYTLIELTDDRQRERMGGGGVEGIIIVTATSSRHLKLLADTLVRQLKIRKLAQRGVIGAKLGAERGDDWTVVDCRNYIVHVLLEQTRQHLNLEALWTGEDELLTLRYNDEDTLDDYVARNPVPDGFGRVNVQEISSTQVSQLQRWNMGHKAVVQKPKRKVGSKKKRGPRLL